MDFKSRFNRNAQTKVKTGMTSERWENVGTFKCSQVHIGQLVKDFSVIIWCKLSRGQHIYFSISVQWKFTVRNAFLSVVEK